MSLKSAGLSVQSRRIVNNCRSCNSNVELAAPRALHLAVGFSGNNGLVSPEWKAVGGWKQGFLIGNFFRGSMSAVPLKGHERT